jgi:hypothetical protein
VISQRRPFQCSSSGALLLLVSQVPATQASQPESTDVPVRIVALPRLAGWTALVLQCAARAAWPACCALAMAGIATAALVMPMAAASTAVELLHL